MAAGVSPNQGFLLDPRRKIFLGRNSAEVAAAIAITKRVGAAVGGAGGFIHVLLGIAVAVMLILVIQGRKLR